MRATVLLTIRPLVALIVDGVAALAAGDARGGCDWHNEHKC